MNLRFKRQRWGTCSPVKCDERFLQEPNCLLSDVGKAIHISFELMQGFWKFRKECSCITVFGSARFGPDTAEYALARELGGVIAEEGLITMTGGGPGIMEAANRGAQEKGGRSIGCNIKLPKEQEPNRYLDLWVDFDFFFVRKMMLLKYSQAFVAFPGGFGTLDEIFETATLIQNAKMRGFPVVLVGKQYWEPMVDFLLDTLLARGAIDKEDMKTLFWTDSPSEVMDCIKCCLGAELSENGAPHQCRVCSEL